MSGIPVSPGLAARHSRSGGLRRCNEWCRIVGRLCLSFLDKYLSGSDLLMLSDQQRRAPWLAARPLQPQDRQAFLDAVAAELGE